MKSDRSGLTLTELLIAGIMLGVVLMTAASFLTTSLKFFKVQNNAPDANTFIAMEYITRSVKKANSVTVDNPGSLGPQLKLRLEKDSTNPPTADTSDDQWVVYRFISNALRTTTGNADTAAPDVASTDLEIVKGLSLSSSSSFTLLNPTSAGNATVVKVRLVTTGGNSGRAMDVTTDIIPGSMSK